MSDSRYEKLKRLIGSHKNDSNRTVRISQDDVTPYPILIHVDSRLYHGATLDEAIDSIPDVCPMCLQYGKCGCEVEPVESLPAPEITSLRRYALLRGWARWLSRYGDGEEELEKIVEIRGTRFGIAIQDDYHALRYQRAKWLKQRASYAVGAYGLTGFASWSDGRWHRASKDEVAAMNRTNMAKDRARAVRAKRLLRESGMLTCSACGDLGYTGQYDETYPCHVCRRPGKITLVPMETT